MFQVNNYFDGQVASLGLDSREGRATVGVMAEGNYEFATSSREVMQLVSGVWHIRLPDTDAWQTFAEGERFAVPAHQKFQVRTEGQVAYICFYDDSEG